jgi:rSAM/selenodomain-associated transferase 1
MKDWLGPSPQYYVQPEGSLGFRMAVAFEQSWLEGAQRTLLIGSDCPAIDEKILHNGFDALKKDNLVIGPAVDGGYYLIGMQQSASPHAEDLFNDSLPWGYPTLLRKTLTIITDNQLSCSRLPTLHDIDQPDDLIHFRHYTHPE